VSEISIALASILMIAVSQLLFKAAMSNSSRNQEGSKSMRMLVLHPMILLGLALNLAAALCWILALRKLQISFLYPLLSINYLLVPLGASVVFRERISRRRGVAIFVICIGVFVCLLAGEG
jgi:drug/metabolite transporter (DMT)-like permease